MSYAASWWAIQVTILGVDVALIVFRRWRLLVIYLVVSQLAVLVGSQLYNLTTQPRPFGVPLRGSWGGWSMPSIQMLALAGLSVVVLYTLVPEGRLRNRLKWAAAVLVAAVALARLHLGVDSPSGIVVGVVIGVSFGVAAFRLFAPSEVFPVTYRRGRSAHLDVGGARGEAIRRALEDQLGLVVSEVVPVGLSGSAGSTPLRLTVEGGTWRAGRRRTCSASSTPAPTCARTAGTSSAASCCTGGWRTRSRSTPCAGSSSRRTTPCGSSATPACPAPGRTASSS